VSVFGRRKKDEAEPEVGPDEVEPDQVAPEEVAPAPPRPSGPWDRDDAPEDEINRVDLGGLLVPVPPGTEVRVDVNEQQEVVAATLVRDGSAMQINVFAAPRSYGIWGEVRDEIGAALRQGGGQAADAEGPYGTELHAAVPTQVPGQGQTLAPARFIGVDGPRWFLRALLTGPAATDAAAAGPLEASLRSIVVVRGSLPMAVRDPIPLRLPKQVQEKAVAAASDTGGAQPSLELPERGPEITERR